MNIFASSSCPFESAQNLDDKRVVKMVLESAQLLNNALPEHERFYKPTHINHPSSRWTSSNKANYSWLVDHFIALCMEYKKRYNKVHACERFMPNITTHYIPYDSSSIEFDNCTPYKDMKDVHMAYKLTLNDKWENDKRIPTFYGRRA